MSLVTETRPIFYILFIILSVFSIGGIYFNGLAGTGATFTGLKIQTICAFVYISYIVITINVLHMGLKTAWLAEVFYWSLMLSMTVWYLKRGTWQNLRV